MSATSGNQLSVGLRFAVVYALNSNGRPAATSASAPYTGLQVEGAKAYTLSVPEPRFINHTGDDRLLAKDVLPPLEGITGEIKAAKNRYDLRALLTNVKVNTIGEAKALAFATDQQGYEPQVGLMLYQQALDSDSSGSEFGLRRWRVSFVPKAVAIPMPPNMDENPSEITYKVNAFVVKNHLWGVALTTLADGCTEAQGLEFMMQGKPWLDNWIGDGVTKIFTLTHTALTTAKISVFKNGVEITGAPITKATTTVTFTTEPALNDDIQVLYEW